MLENNTRLTVASQTQEITILNDVISLFDPAVRPFLSSMVVLYHMNDEMQRVYITSIFENKQKRYNS